MSKIEQARDVLATWRNGTTIGPWSREEMPETGENRIVREFEFFGEQLEEVAPGGLHHEDARLIVGTAGNPELLDFLTEFLDDAAYIRAEGDIPNTVALTMRADRLAAAILAADNRGTA